ncbi:Uu.00g024750.m01.CDS01 [Anthostomella pinea]|uniref:Uu.00g024750.m01.CDS01 n=1 Tax=Anthostomella pinea TaxID=933095 RepID=A0AAI8YCF7_9PEZI|nr:Uu.00g024750.m01.CDS01 [Anthostomella pinea]
MSDTIKNVAVVGVLSSKGSGNLGTAVVQELTKAGFNVTVLTRKGSPSTLPPGVASREVDYESVDSLTPALQGQHAVVSTIATAAVRGQHPLVDAAVAGKVSRFIPSEFGINSRILGTSAIGKILQGKVQTLDYINQKSKENPSFTWTGISTGLFFDWVSIHGLEHGSLGLDKSTKTATIYDSGSEAVQTSNLGFIGRAIAAILSDPSKTVNRYITIASFNPSQAELLEIVERETGEKWNVNHVTTAEQEKFGLEKLGRGDYSAFSNLLRKRIYEDGAGLAVKGADSANSLLGLEDEEDLEAAVKAWLGG